MTRHAIDIRIKRAYDPPDYEDGERILVDRLWPRGLRKEAAALTLWLKQVAPSAPLRRWFGHDPARWAEFERRYRAELAENDEAVTQLAERARHARMTLLYAARDTAHTHAIILAAYLRAYLQHGHGDPAA